MKEQTPIKRHPALVSFSKEHHFGLLLIWKIRQGLTYGIAAERISRYIIYFFNADLRAHFKDEETILFPALPADNMLRLRAEAEHRDIYEMVVDISKNMSDEILIRKFADILERHIRYEERTLFNHLQDNISTDLLNEISKRTTIDPDAEWTDSFWIIASSRSH